MAVSRVLYRGFTLMENGEKVVFYIFDERKEFDTLPLATNFIDDWYKGMVVGVDFASDKQIPS
ncbi:MAG: hypothetical protein HY865_22260 [Chloroflexi bacterium]|nr:hypothetical protein [Chloroflexota bacterium]